ncbi:trypsin-like peptidase domain-containing protein [Streptomyces sp. NPDC002680]|uniref:VMAP-C domain-containing protein n=1 Tax=Streptomyces sp. NPDC002680 TaxID=3364659 RepID=UPI0036C52AA8
MTEEMLDVLVTRATVRIGPENEPDKLWGSGFFVAPGWVLSCAHVLPLTADPEDVGSLRVRVRGYGGLDVRARPAYWLGGTDSEQDLVLIRLTENVAHTCVRLTDRYDAPQSAVTAYGWYPLADGAPQRWKGETVCNGKVAHALTLGPTVEIPRGASGGPLLDRGRGLVVGVVKARRPQKDGGLAVAATALRGFRHALVVRAGEDKEEQGELGDNPYAALIRAHDIWHRNATGSGSWVKAQDGMAAGGERRWGPRDSAAASALLAGLPAPDSPVELEKVIGRVLGDQPLWLEEDAPRDWRDGHGWLYDHKKEAADLVALHYLRVVAQLCGPQAPGPAAALEQWVESRAEELPHHERALLMGVVPGAPAPWAEAPRAQGWRADPRESDCAEDDEGPVVAVELEPDLFRPKDRFHWRIWTWIGGPETVRAVDEGSDGEGVSLADLEDALTGPLTRTFGQLDGERRARLEVALPVEHFGVDARVWQLRPAVRRLRLRPEERPFGVHRPVVLRSLKRRGEPTSVWRERWRGVAEGEPQVLYVKSEAYARQVLDQGPPGAVPVLCRTPAESTGALSRAVEAGYGVALWNLEAEHPHGCGAGCADLQVRADKLLSSVGRATALPERLRILREDFSLTDSKKAPHPDLDWAQHLALFYDDPRRPIPLCDDLLESP